MFVRAKWIPTSLATSCVANEAFEDTTAEYRKYLAYWIEDSRGRVRNHDLVSGDDFWCCGGLKAEGALWRDGIVITVVASVWNCEPAGMCYRHRFTFVRRRGPVAMSDWTWFPWEPAKHEPFEGTVEEGCIAYPMTLMPGVRGDAIVFEPALPPEVKEGDLIERQLIDELSAYCPRPSGPVSPTAIDLFPTANSNAAKPLLVRDSDRIEIVSAVVRAERTSQGTLTTKLFRLGIRALGQRGFATPASLKSVGFLGF